ncbi:Hsp70 family protein OS=Streptomyces alboniger OX=132473 GN=CP975_28345 PE=3 SV=1 [Streptomyces alboniger]
MLGLRFGGAPPLRVRIDRSDFDAYVDRHVRRTVDRAQALLDRAGMRQEDVDTLLLVGGGTRMEQVRSRVAGLGRHLARVTPELLALGALKHALRLAGGGASSGPSAREEGPLELAALSQDTLSDALLLTATLVGGAGNARPTRRIPYGGRPWPMIPCVAHEARAVQETRAAREAHASDVRDVERARLLIGQGVRTRRPRCCAGSSRRRGSSSTAWTAPARARSPEEVRPAPVIDRASRRKLARAQALLSLGHDDYAVQAAHVAWQSAATRPAGADMLDAMIDVHCAAAMADMSPEHFADAERWLNCAYGHDPTNVRLRGPLAERTYRHAVELDRRAERDEAIGPSASA